MSKDVERLDNLINHLLDAARLDQTPVESEAHDVELSAVLLHCAETACQRYRLPAETIRVDVLPALVRGRPIDVEMLFRNLVDNAVKYAGDVPQVEIESRVNGQGKVVTRISDNGQGIPAALRRKIFGRFVRVGSELERSKPGTGLGLYIVRTLVRRMRGSITVRGRGQQPGTVFEVELPGQAVPAEQENVGGDSIAD
ncbi:MAG: sensor histidine kinase [Pirellulales bacterium]